MPETYANAPLVRTIFQIRFAGELAIETARAKIQASLRHDLPKLYVPQAVVGAAPALQPVVFKSHDESEAVEVAINSFTYTTVRYPGYRPFRDRVLGFAEVFTRHVPEVQSLNRVGLRYVNRFPILRSSVTAPIPVNHYLNVGINLPPAIPADLSEINFVFTVQMDVGSLKVRVAREQGSGPAEPEVLLLDFDFAQLNHLVVSDLAEYLDRAHTHTKSVFNELISEKYLPVMRGEAE